MRSVLMVLLVLGVAGCASAPRSATKVTVEFRAGGSSPKEGFTQMTVAGTGQTIYLAKDALLTNQDVKSAHAIARPLVGPQIEIVFTAEGAQKFARATEANLMKPLGILIDGKLISAPIVREKIANGKVLISGGLTKEEAQRIADGISGQ